jgi:hypothetical protein
VPVSRLDRVRGAACAFLRRSPAKWSRRDLAGWLVCHYAPCVARPLPRHPDDRDDDRVKDREERAVDEALVDRLVHTTRGRTLRLLADLVVPWRASPIARLAVASGTVARQHDARGAIAYSPVDLPNLPLSERVASLFIADYLNGPGEYWFIRMCQECGELSFATELAHPAWCNSSSEQWKVFTAAAAISRAAGA